MLLGNYWVVETTVLAGYDPAADVAITVSSTTTVVVNLVDPWQRRGWSQRGSSSRL